MLKPLIKKVLAVGFLSLILSQLLIAAMPAPKAAALPTDQLFAALRADQKRRRLDILVTCLGRVKDHVNFDKISSYTDLIHEPEKQNIVTGFDLSNNGVLNCNTGISGGLVELGHGANEKDAQQYYLDTISGTNGFTQGRQTKIVKSVALGSLDKLGREAGSARDAIPGLTWDVARARMFGSRGYPDLINACYDAKPENSPGRQDGKGDFTVPHVGDFFLRNMDWKKEFSKEGSGWIDILTQANAATQLNPNPYAHIGDVNLGFTPGLVITPTITGGSILGGAKADFKAATSDFYPLGRDFFHANDYTGPGIVDCQYVNKYKGDIFKSNIQVINNKAILVDDAGNPVDLTKLPGDKSAQPGLKDDKGSGSLQCENSLGLSIGDAIHPVTGIGKGLNWLVCNILRAVNGAINYLDSLIIDYLDFHSSTLDDDKAGYYAMWSTFRFIAVGLLVLIGLVMVISQMIGIGVFDAYTVKKILPRMFAAAILITISWSLCKIMIDAISIVGGSIRSLMYAPFGGADALAGALVPKSQTTAEASAGLAVGGFFLIGTTNWLVILSFALPALIGIIIGFIFIILRQMVIILLVVTAPLAVVAYILPNTEKVWDFWRESFFKALIMYPLIVAFLSIGRIFASLIVRNPNNTAPAINQIIAIIAYFGPYFAIPATFKFAGGLLGTLHGAANDRSKGILDRNKKMRQKNQAQTWSKTKSGSRFQERNPFARGFNQFSSGAATGMKGHFGVGTRGNAARDLALRNAALEAAKNPLMQQLQFDDDGIMAMSLGAGSAGRATSELKRLRSIGALDPQKWDDERINKAVSTASAVGFNKENSTAAIDLMAKNKNFSLPAGPAGTEAMVAATDALAGVQRDATGKVVSGNKQMADNLMGSFEYNSRGSGRLDVGMHDYDTGQANLAKAWDKGSLGQHAQGTGASLQSFADHFAGTYDAQGKLVNRGLIHSNNADERKQAAVALLEMQSMLPNATASNQDIINKTLGANGIGVGFDKTATYQYTDPNDPTKTLTGTRSMSVEEQLVNASAGAVSERELRGKARVYDSGVPYDQRGGPTQQTTGSDSRIKRNVLYLRTTEEGIRLYRFQYLWSDQVYVGVMAQDLLVDYPQAISVDQIGFYKVNYSMLGLRMLTIEEWEMSKLVTKDVR